VQELVALSEQLGVGVIESVPNHMNFPTTHPGYQGVQWNERSRMKALGRATWCWWSIATCRGSAP
jgi:acetolactate synthase-1/2/3 large subunit